jgi:hypothetical protein
MRDLVAHLLLIDWLLRAGRRSGEKDAPPYCDWAAGQLARIQRQAHAQVFQNFNRSKNLEAFAKLFLDRISAQTESAPDENLVLQQI